MLIYYNY